jgi:hypothetical protein
MLVLHAIPRSLAGIIRSLVRSLVVAGIARWCQSLAGMVRWSGFLADTFVRQSLRSRCARGRLLRARAVPRLLRSLLLRSCLTWPQRHGVPALRHLLRRFFAPHNLKLAWSFGCQTFRRTHQPQRRSRRRASALGLFPHTALDRTVGRRRRRSPAAPTPGHPSRRAWGRAVRPGRAAGPGASSPSSCHWRIAPVAVRAVLRLGGNSGRKRVPVCQANLEKRCCREI